MFLEPPKQELKTSTLSPKGYLLDCDLCSAALESASNTDHFLDAENIQANLYATDRVSRDPAANYRRPTGGSIFSAEPAGIGESMMQGHAMTLPRIPPNRLACLILISFRKAL